MNARTGTFFARHRLIAGWAAAFLALLIGSSVTLCVQSRRIAQLRDVAAAADARAQASEQRTEAVSRFLLDSFSDSSNARCKETTTREILEQSAARAGKQMCAQPELQAQLLEP